MTRDLSNLPPGVTERMIPGNEPELPTVHVPGMLLVTIDEDGVESITFLPHAGDAGYFGPETETFSGPDVAPEVVWKAIADAIDDDTVKVRWEG